MTLAVRTPDGQDLGSIELAGGKLVPSGGAAAGLARTALRKAGNAQAAYDYLNGYDNGYLLVGEPAVTTLASTIGRQFFDLVNARAHATSPMTSTGAGVNLDDTLTGQLLANDPLTIGGQVELTAIHGHHVKGTAYTFRHGWLPLIGKQLNDTIPQWMADAQVKKDRAAAADVARTVARTGRDAPAPAIARKRKLTPEQKAMVAANAGRAEYVPRNTLPSPAGPGSGAASTAADVFAKAFPPVEAPSPPPVRRPQTISDLHPTEHPQTIAGLHEQLESQDLATDPLLGSLAGQGTDASALKAYVDARVAADVAQQVGQISAKQAADTKAALAKMHAEQQKLIAVTRKMAVEGNNDNDADLQKHTVANTLFTMAGVGIAVAGIVTGMAPVAAALIAGLVPLVNVIHDYARNLG